MSATAITVADLFAPLREVRDRGLKFSGGTLTWREHRIRAESAAAQILRLVPPGSPPHFGVVLPNVVELSILLHAAAISPLVLVALNPLRTPDGLAADAATADCTVIVTDARHRHLLSSAAGHVTIVDVTDLDPTPIDVPTPFTPAPDDLFALVFTSGTSGDPKAVRCNHSKVAAAGAMLAARFELGRADTVYVSMPLFHSNAILAGWCVGVASGGSVAIAKSFSASGFLRDVRAYGATYANYVGTPLSYVLATPSAADDHDNPLRNVYGNEGHPDDLRAFAERFDTRVTDGYGSTEGGIAIKRTPDTPRGALGPLTGDIAVIDVDTEQPCVAARFDTDGRLINADHAVGELVNITGSGGFSGYYGNPDADAERMRGGWYRSGDLACVDEEGFVHFVGRVGDWLRVRGENLGTRPIAAAIREHPSVLDVAVYGVAADRIGDVVMAAIVSDGTVTDIDLAASILTDTRLSEHQRPQYIRFTSSIPRTATFKILTRRMAAESTATDDTVYELTVDGYRARQPEKKKGSIMTDATTVTDTSADEPHLLTELVGNTLVVTMNRPRSRNALSAEMTELMRQAWDRADSDPAVRVVVLTGAARTFCAGADLKAMTSNHPGDSFDGAMDMSVITALLKGRRLSVPLIAAVEGAAIAGGTEILQATDIRVAGQSAKFGVSEAKWGLFPLGGSAVRLVRQIPYTIAMDLLLTGRHIMADEALRIGLVGHVVPDGSALDKAMSIAETICANGPLAVAAIVKTVRDTEGLHENDAFRIEAELGTAVFRSDDAKEGPRAFMEKRAPQFRGR